MSLKKLEPCLVIAISLTIITASFLPFFYNLFHPPENFVFTGAHNYPPDYLSYLTQIKSGLDNHLLYTNKFTTESSLVKPVPTKFHFTVLGFLGKLININNPIFLYHIARLVLGFAHLLIIYLFISLFFKKPLYRLTAFSLAIFSSPLPRIIEGKLSTYLSDYTYLNAINRVTFLPHHLLRNLCLYLLFFFLLKRKKPSVLLFSCLIGLELGLISPHHSIVFLLVGLAYLLIISLKQKKIAQEVFLFLGLTAVSVLLGTAILYSTTLNPIGETVKSWEIAYPLLPPISIFLALGPVFFLSLPAFLNKKSCQKKFLLLPILISISLLLTFCPIEKYLPISHIRFLQIPLFPALSILAVQGIENILQLIRKTSLQRPFFIIILSFSLLFSLPSYFFTIQYQINYHRKNPTNFFIRNQETEALAFLDQNISEKDNLMANEFSGNLIPAFTGNHVFVGHVLNTYQYGQKRKIGNKFFGGKMSAEETKNLFKTHQLKYIWFGELEAGFGINLPQTYPWLNLKPVFQNPSVTIYQVGINF